LAFKIIPSLDPQEAVYHQMLATYVHLFHRFGSLPENAEAAAGGGGGGGAAHSYQVSFVICSTRLFFFVLVYGFLFLLFLKQNSLQATRCSCCRAWWKQFRFAQGVESIAIFCLLNDFLFFCLQKALLAYVKATTSKDGASKQDIERSLKHLGSPDIINAAIDHLCQEGHL
jgi:hypothetical protein